MRFAISIVIALSTIGAVCQQPNTTTIFPPAVAQQTERAQSALVVKLCNGALTEFHETKDLTHLEFAEIGRRIQLIGECLEADGGDRTPFYLLASSTYLLEQNRRMAEYLRRHQQQEQFIKEDTIALDVTVSPKQ